ncbi:MAG: alpha/beta hydrolase [Gammaproteobacteria bacterium]
MIGISCQSLKKTIAVGLLAFGISFSLTSCMTTRYIAEKIVAPPGDDLETLSVKLRDVLAPFYASQSMIAVGPPPAMLSMAVLDPGDYPVKITTTMHDEGFVVKYDVDIPARSRDIYLKAAKNIPHTRPHATIILLPGYALSKETMLGYAFLFAENGIRVVLLDPRAQGQSTGAFVTYGPLESDDLSQVIEKLKTNGTIVGPLYLLGVSYGAAIALETAAKDPSVQAVVAIEPFSSVKAVIPRFVKEFRPLEAQYLSAKDVDQALEASRQITGFNIVNSGPINIVNKIKSPILYLVGTDDVVTPPNEVRSLAARSYSSDLCQILDKNHLSLPIDTGATWPIIRQWLKINIQDDDLGDDPAKSQLPHATRPLALDKTLGCLNNRELTLLPDLARGSR